jgi:hypothetical protein
MFTGLKPEYEKTDLWIQFGKTISYPDVTSHKQLRSQLNYGMVIGRNPQVGNLIVENLLDRKIEVIDRFYEIISLDNTIRAF